LTEHRTDDEAAHHNEKHKTISTIHRHRQTPEKQPWFIFTKLINKIESGYVLLSTAGFPLENPQKTSLQNFESLLVGLF
jgi:hypothetical protein